MRTLTADIINAAQKARKTLLEYEPFTNGHCFTASFALGIALTDLGVDVRVVQGTYNDSPHFWLETLNGWYLDITADQFGGDPIIWGHRDDLPEFKKVKHHSYNLETITPIVKSLQT